jgi:hypothetical protein
MLEGIQRFGAGVDETTPLAALKERKQETEFAVDFSLN